MDEFQALADRMMHALPDFSGEVPKETDFWRFSAHEPSRDEFPVPELVLFVLRNVMGFPWSGRREKVRWSVYCTFRGEPLAFELRKFGFAVRHAKDSTVDIKSALNQLKKAVQLADGVLQQMANEQAREGNVTVANLFPGFDARYRFFRDKADEAYATSDPPMKPMRFDENGNPMAWTGTFMKGPREGSYYTAAMIDAFFSRLEHLLVLVLPFIEFDSKGDALRQFIGATWDQKFKAVFQVSRDTEAKRIYDALKAVKERLRNPFSHGGFEKGWASLYFHVPTIGALPASLSHFRHSVQFSFLPVQHEDQKDLCKLFDDVDRLFAMAHTRMGYEYAASGLNVAFDDKSKKEYQRAMASNDTMREFIMRQHDLADMHTNMDY